MRILRLLRQSRLSALVVVCFYCGLLPGHAQTEVDAQSSACAKDYIPLGNLCLRETSDAVSHVLCSKGFAEPCVHDLVQQLGNMQKDDRCGAQKLEALMLRQEIIELVTTAALQVDGFIAEIDSETGHIRAKRDELTDRRDAAVKWSTLGAAVGTGGGAVGSSLALASKTATAGNWVGATFGGVGAFFSFLGFFQQTGVGPKGCFPDLREDTKKKEAKRQCPKLATSSDKSKLEQQAESNTCSPPQNSLCSADNPGPGCSPRMLYALLFPECSANAKADFHSGYDKTIERYLDQPRASGTRRKDLVATWGKQEELRESKQLFTGNADPRKLSIDDLDERTNKLADLRWQVSLMKRDLSRLTEDLASELSCR